MKCFGFYIGLVVLALVDTMVHAHIFLAGEKLGMMVRIIATGAIYQKVSSKIEIV